MHGFYQIAEDAAAPYVRRFCEKFRIDRQKFSWKLLETVKTFFLVDTAWIFFRADSVRSGVRILLRSLNFSNTGLLLNNGLFQLGLDTRNMMILTIALVVLLLSSLMRERGYSVLEWLSGQNVIFRYFVYWGAVLLILLSMDIMGQEFIYFQF